MQWIYSNVLKDHVEQLEFENRKIESLQVFVNPELYFRFKKTTDLPGPDAVNKSSSTVNWVRSELRKRLSRIKERLARKKDDK